MLHSVHAGSTTANESEQASLREGLKDMFTVRRLGAGGRLAASLTNTNCIESMISIARDTTRNVKRWRDGKMIKRWCAAGMLNAERSFSQCKGHRQLPTFVAALARHVKGCYSGVRCCTSRLSGRTDAPAPSGRDAKLDARDDLGPNS
jgi:hypothetical protein